ncbi:MAG: winged helix-turn-helix transcriptional regulator [Chloroflexi bacterium]|nr:winged helix-turn-helix transcriptional regulator [Chloroflexota bacterium]
MDKLIFQRHAEVCQTLANPVRLEILSLLRAGEKGVGELAELAELSQANVSQHLSNLRSKGLVSTRREGTHIYYCIANPKIIRACDLIREVLVEQATEHAELVGATLAPRSRR